MIDFFSIFNLVLVIDLMLVLSFFVRIPTFGFGFWDIVALSVCGLLFIFESILLAKSEGGGPTFESFMEYFQINIGLWIATVVIVVVRYARFRRTLGLDERQSSSRT